MDSLAKSSILLGKPITFIDGVNIHVPTIQEIIESQEEFEKSVLALTVLTRQIFVEAREIDSIEQKFPTVWELMCNPQLNVSLGGLTGEPGSKLSDGIISAIAYWTKLPNPTKEEVEKYTEEEKKTKPKGFVFLENGGKIINYDTEWIIDKAEFDKFVDIVKVIIDYRRPEDLAPKIKSDAAHEVWLRMHRNKKSMEKGKEISWADRMMMLSVSTPSYIPIEEIGKMSVFQFNQLFKIVNQIDAYEMSLGILMSPKFSAPEGKVKPPKHWRENYRIGDAES